MSMYILIYFLYFVSPFIFIWSEDAMILILKWPKTIRSLVESTVRQIFLFFFPMNKMKKKNNNIDFSQHNTHIEQCQRVIPMSERRRGELSTHHLDRLDISSTFLFVFQRLFSLFFITYLNI